LIGSAIVLSPTIALYRLIACVKIIEAPPYILSQDD